MMDGYLVQTHFGALVSIHPAKIFYQSYKIIRVGKNSYFSMHCFVQGGWAKKLLLGPKKTDQSLDR